MNAPKFLQITCRMIVKLVLIALIVIGMTTPAAHAANRAQADELWRAVVQIRLIYTFEQDGETKVEQLAAGSGSLIRADGTILTNFHVVDTATEQKRINAKYEGVSLSKNLFAIYLSEADDETPVLRYYAEVAAKSASLDLAVLRIVQDENEEAITPDDLDLPFLELGNSDLLKLGDKFSILGYPTIGGDTITFSDGSVGGFVAQGKTKRAWIKTTADISGGNSGGAAIDTNGKLIGIPTQAGIGNGAVDCRQLADTNGDGNIDEDDVCVPLGKVNAMRPINLATVLIREAANQTQDDEPLTRLQQTFRLINKNCKVIDDEEPLTLTTMQCKAGSVDVFFDAYENEDDMNEYLNTLVGETDAQTWHFADSEDVVRGSYYAYKSTKKSAVIVWSFDERLVTAVAQRKDGNEQALEKWWNGLNLRPKE